VLGLRLGRSSLVKATDGMKNHTALGGLDIGINFARQQPARLSPNRRTPVDDIGQAVSEGLDESMP
jgi:hypothetical protein